MEVDTQSGPATIKYPEKEIIIMGFVRWRSEMDSLSGYWQVSG